MNKYLDLKLGYECNNNCLHCVISDQKKRACNIRGNENRSFQECTKEILSSKNNNCTSVTLTGGEPTIRKDFLQILKFIKKEKMHILLQSNGRKFEDKKFTKQCAKLIDFTMIALHSHSQDIHDKITQEKNSFSQTVKGIENLLQNNAEIGIKIVISKLNIKDLLLTCQFAKDLGVGYINIAFPHINGNAKYNFKTIIPTYTEIKEELEKIIQWSQNNNFNIDFEEILPCVFDKNYPLKYFTDLKINNGHGEVKQLDSDMIYWKDARASMKKKGIICQKCILTRFCDGFWQEYIQWRGFEEFKPVKTIPQEIKQMLSKELMRWKK